MKEFWTPYFIGFMWACAAAAIIMGSRDSPVVEANGMFLRLFPACACVFQATVTTIQLLRPKSPQPESEVPR